MFEINYFYYYLLQTASEFSPGGSGTTKRHTNKTYYKQNTDNTSNTQNIHIKYKYHTKYNTESK
jgi:hypothetical protein